MAPLCAFLTPTHLPRPSSHQPRPSRRPRSSPFLSTSTPTPPRPKSPVPPRRPTNRRPPQSFDLQSAFPSSPSRATDPSARTTLDEAFADLLASPRGTVPLEDLERLVKSTSRASQLARTEHILTALYPFHDHTPSTTAFNHLITAAGRSGDLALALRVIAKNTSFDALPAIAKARVYEAAVDAAARCGRMDDAFRLVDVCVERLVPRTEGMYAALIRGAARTRPLHEAMAVLRRMRGEGMCVRNVGTYNALLEGCARAGRVLSAMSVLKRMERESGLQPDVWSYNALLACCGKARDPERAFEVVEKMRRVGVRMNAVGYNSVVVACAGVGNVERALEVAKRMEEEGIVLNIVTYNNLLEACCNSGQLERAFSLAKEMIQKRGLKANSYTYDTLIRGCSKLGQFDTALRLLTSMRTAGVSPTVVTFSVAIAACARDGGLVALSHALQLEKDMHAAGVQPNIVTYNSLIHTCARSGQVAKAFLVVDRMRAHRVAPDVVTLCSLVDACGRAGQVEHAFEMVRDLTLEFPRIRLNVPVYNALINACARSQNMDRLVDAFRSMRRCGLRPNVVTYSTLVSAYASAGDMVNAMATVQRMRRRKLQPNMFIYTSLVAGFARTGDCDAALEMLAEARVASGQPDAELYTASILAAYVGNRMEMAVELQEEMKSVGYDVPNLLNSQILRGRGGLERSGSELEALLKATEALGFRPTRVACEALVEAYAVERNVESAFGVLPTMARLGYPPNLRTYKKLIECCGVANDFGRAEQVFKSLRDSGTGPGKICYGNHHWVQLFEAMLHAAMQVGNLELAGVYLEDMRENCGAQYASAFAKRWLS